MSRRGDRYGFAVGRVMVLRTRLLGHAAFERLLDAATFEDQRRVLSETHFGRFLEHADGAAAVERAIDESMRDLYEDFLDRAGLPAPIVAYFRTPYDFAALKAYLKAKALGVPVELAGVRLGVVDPGSFEDRRGPGGAVGETLRAVRDSDPPLGVEEIEAAVDTAMFAELARLARESRVAYLLRLALKETDAANAKVLLRCAIARRSPEDARAMLVGRGEWDAAAAAALVRRPEDLATAIAAAKVLPPAAAADLLDLAKIDPLVDGATARLARDAALMGVGPEAVLGYLLARRAEAVTVRSLLVGRLAGLPRDLIAGRMRGAAS